MKNGITKQQSNMIQGLAILMMLYHHLFSTPEALGIEYISLLNFNGYNLELKTAWFFKICVGIYAFLTGYGMCRSLNSNIETSIDFIAKLKHDYKMILKQLINFYIQYFIVFIIFIPIGFVFYNKTFVFVEFLKNLIGISSTYNGAWWYVFFYVKIMILLPLINSFFCLYKDKKSRIIYIIFYGIIIISTITIYIMNKEFFTIIIEFFQPAFLLCFLVGYFISKFRLFELFFNILGNRIMTILGIIGIISVILVRMKIAKDASSAGLDFIFVPVFVYGFCCILELLPKLQGFFKVFGSCSTFMWLTHVFFYDHYAKSIVMASRISVGIYITLILLSLVTAIILNKLVNIFKKAYL